MQRRQVRIPAATDNVVRMENEETCIHMSDTPPDSDSDPWCFGDEGKHAEDCFTHEAYTCTDGFWVKDARESCPMRFPAIRMANR